MALCLIATGRATLQAKGCRVLEFAQSDGKLRSRRGLVSPRISIPGLAASIRSLWIRYQRISPCYLLCKLMPQMLFVSFHQCLE